MSLAHSNALQAQNFAATHTVDHLDPEISEQTRQVSRDAAIRAKAAKLVLKEHLSGVRPLPPVQCPDPTSLSRYRSTVYALAYHRVLGNTDRVSFYMGRLDEQAEHLDS